MNQNPRYTNQTTLIKNLIQTVTEKIPPEEMTKFLIEKVGFTEYDVCLYIEDPIMLQKLFVKKP